MGRGAHGGGWRRLGTYSIIICDTTSKEVKPALAKLSLYCPILTVLKIAGEEQAEVSAPVTFLRGMDLLILQSAAGWEDECGWF